MSSRGIKHFARLVFLVAVVSVVCVPVFAQNPIVPPSDKPKPKTEVLVAPQSAKTDVDETFELNIDVRRFTETNFEASTSVDTNGDASNVNLEVGVSLNAGRIDVLLRNVHGRVRFRGTLTRILEVIGKRQISPSEPR